MVCGRRVYTCVGSLSQMRARHLAATHVRYIKCTLWALSPSMDLGGWYRPRSEHGAIVSDPKRPFPCSYEPCSKAFARRSDLQRCAPDLTPGISARTPRSGRTRAPLTVATKALSSAARSPYISMSTRVHAHSPAPSATRHFPIQAR